MAQVPAAAASTALSSALTQAGSFLVNLGASYLLTRLTAQDGPRLDNLAAAGGEYGVAMPRTYGEICRLTGVFMAQADIKETRHTIEDHSELIGAATGAIQGFLLGGPVGAIIGGVLGGLLGAVTPDQHYYTYSDTFALLLTDRAGQDPIEALGKAFANGKLLFNPSETPHTAEVLDANGKLVSRTYGKNRYFKSLTVYGGSTLQGVDPVLADVLGEDGAYPFTAYVVIEDLQLAQFGNSVPPIEFLTTVATGESLADVMEHFASAAGIDPDRDLSTGLLTGFAVRGYVVASESTCWDAAKPLLPAFGVDASEVSGQVRFAPRNQALRATIPVDDMGAHAAGDSPSSKFMFQRSADLELPKESALTFLDPARDYLPNTATARRSEGDARSNVTASIPLAMSAGEGASAAALMLWDAWLGRTGLTFSLTDKWLSLAVGLAYAIPVGNGQYVPYRITRRTRGYNGLIEAEAVSDEQVSYTASVAGSSGTLPDDDESTLFAETRLILMDMPITADAHDDYGFYAVMGAEEPTWERGKVQLSGDGGANYATVIDSNLSCPAMGDVTGTLAAGSTTGLDDSLDTTSVLTVVLLHDGMTLESATDADLDAWMNFAFVGGGDFGVAQGEYLQFKTATKIAEKTWQLTNLRRGRKGTDWALGLHGAGEQFALLGGDGVFRLVYGDTLKWGVPFKARAVSLHEDPADGIVIDFTNTGEGKRPYSPVNVTGTWDGSNNLTIDWDYRSRMNSGALGVDDRPDYEVEITTGTGRTTTVLAATSWIYTAVMQTADGVTAGDSVTGRVRQLSDVNDGRWRDFTITGPLGTSFDDTAITFDETDITWDAI